MKFLLDANFLTIPGQFKVDVFRELEEFGKPELYTLNLVVKELEKLKSRHARLALGLVKKEGVKILFSKTSNTDREIVRIASKGGFVVCTQDKKLIEKLKKKGISVVSLRQKRLLIKK